MKLAKEKFSLTIGLNLTAAGTAISATSGIVDEFGMSDIGKDGEGIFDKGGAEGAGTGGADGAKPSLAELVMDNDFIIELTSLPSW